MFHQFLWQAKLSIREGDLLNVKLEAFIELSSIVIKLKTFLK